MKKNKWYEVLIVAILCIILSPVILCVYILLFFQKLVTAPFEYRKYKRSRYYEVYKKKYKSGITQEPRYLLQNKLLEHGIELEEIKKPYGELCLVNNDFCFVLFTLCDVKRSNDGFEINLCENSPYISIEDFIAGEKEHFAEECITRKFVMFIWREDDEYMDILSDEHNKSSLRNMGINFFIDSEELAKAVCEMISNSQ